MSRYHDPQLQEAENYPHLFIRAQIFANLDVKTHILFPISVIKAADKTGKNEKSCDQQDKGCGIIYILNFCSTPQDP